MKNRILPIIQSELEKNFPLHYWKNAKKEI